MRPSATPSWGPRKKALTEISEKSPFNFVEMNDPAVGVVTSGISYQYVKEVLPKASVLKLGMTFPLPAAMIRDFAAKVSRLFVVEELEPYLEDEIRRMGLKVEGKTFFTNQGELTPDLVAEGFAKAGVLPKAAEKPQPVPGASMPRPPLMCAGCSHRGLFYALGKMKGIVHGDIGCYTLSALPPIQGIDTCVCMGGGISMAHGTAKAMEAPGRKISVPSLP